MPQEPWHRRKAAKSDRIIQLNCREVRSHASYKTTRTQEPQEPWHPGKAAKSDRIIQLNCGEVRSHASYKTTRTWENFNSQ